MGVPYSIFCCFKSTTNARLIDLEAGGGGGGTYSTDVNTMLASADNAGIRTAIGLGTTGTPIFGGITIGTGNAKLQYTPGGTLTLTRASDGGAIFVANADSNNLGIGSINTDRITNRFTGANPAVLEMGGSGVIEQRNGSIKQKFLVYNNFISSTVYERAVMGWNATTGNLDIGTEFLGGSGMAAKQIDFVTGGAVRMSIGAAGNLGVGISAPVAKLDVLFPTSSTGLNLASNGATSVSNFVTWSTVWGSVSGGIKSYDDAGGWGAQIYSNSKIWLSAGGVDSPDLTITTAGLVGIGTGLPTEKLHVLGGKVLFGDPADSTGTAGNGDLTLRAYRTPQLHLSCNNTGNNFFGLNLESNNISLGGILLNPASGEVKMGGFHSGGYFPTFYSNNAEVMRFNVAGLLGIGTTNPVAKTDIAETWNAPALAVTAGSANGVTTILNFATQLTAIPVGSTIVVAGVTPAGYNGTYVVTSSATNAVAYASTNNAAYVSGGTIERVFTSVKLNVTDTASNAASKLMDLQVGGVSKFNVDKTGNAIAAGYVSAGAGSSFLNATTLRIANSGGEISLNSGIIAIQNATGLGWTDAPFFRDAPGILAQRNGTAAQAFRVYNNHTGTNTSDWFEINWQPTGTNSVLVGTTHGGGGSARPMSFVVGGVAHLTMTNNTLSVVRTAGQSNAIDVTNGTDANLFIGVSASGAADKFSSIGTYTAASSLLFRTNGTERFRITAAGNLIAGLDNTYDIGASGANRPRNIYAGTALISGGSVQVGSGGNQLIFGGRGSISPFLDGVWAFYNSSANDFGRICLGGGTSAFPAIKRNGTGIDIVLANDSAFAPISSLYQRFGTNTPEGAVSAPVGAVFHRTDGGSGSSFYVKESGSGPNGWVGK